LINDTKQELGYSPPTEYSFWDRLGQLGAFYNPFDGDTWFDDTSTPRRGLLDTHNAISRGVPGNQMVTSTKRNFNLGSMSSDHAAGRAYDLVGQNLGMYASLVNQSGGYADFHGVGGSRHLHVVPNGVPLGDTATPYMGAGSMDLGSTGGGDTNMNIQVYAAPGMNEEALANAVVRKIQRAQRNAAERR